MSSMSSIKRKISGYREHQANAKRIKRQDRKRRHEEAKAAELRATAIEVEQIKKAAKAKKAPATKKRTLKPQAK